MLQRENGPQAKWQIAKIYQAAQKCAANDEKAASRGSKISKNVKTISAKGKRGSMCAQHWTQPADGAL